MADGKFLIGKPAGGVTTVTMADGASNTNLVLPESGTVASVSAAVTDNAIARYDGTTGKLQNSGVVIDDNGNLLLTSGTGGLGYGTGSGGTVTQLTSKSTVVTLNKPTGKIIMHNAALAAGAKVEFVLLNSLIEVTDTITTSITDEASEARNYRTEHVNSIIGSAYIRLTNLSGVSLSEPIAIQFSIIKGATA